MISLKSKHRGREFLVSCTITNASPLGMLVADLLGHWFKGLYHMDQDIHKVEWSNPHHIAIKFRGEIATWDFNKMTELVVLCHDLCLRCSVRAKTIGYLELMFHQREREGSISERHPTMEQAISDLRSYYQVEDV